jgi:hypothetical protein
MMADQQLCAFLRSVELVGGPVSFSGTTTRTGLCGRSVVGTDLPWRGLSLSCAQPNRLTWVPPHLPRRRTEALAHIRARTPPLHVACHVQQSTDCCAVQRFSCKCVTAPSFCDWFLRCHRGWALGAVRGYLVGNFVGHYSVLPLVLP